MKLATFVVAEIIYQHVKKKVTKLSPAAVVAAAKKGVQKTATFFLLLLFHI
jgi:hypothetical protein